MNDDNNTQKVADDVNKLGNDAQRFGQDAQRFGQKVGEKIGDEVQKTGQKIGEDVHKTGEDISHLARAAIDAIRQATDDFASKAGIAKSEAIDALRTAGKSAVDEAKLVTETGLDQIGRAVVRNPVAAIAIAAGAGLLLGMLTRSDSRYRPDSRR